MWGIIQFLREHLCASGTVNMHCFVWSVFYMSYIYFLRGQQHQTVVNIRNCLGRGGGGGGGGGGVNSCPIPFKLCIVCSVHGLVHVHNTFTNSQLSTTPSLCCGSVALFCNTSRPHPHPPQERERRVLFQTVCTNFNTCPHLEAVLSIQD